MESRFIKRVQCQDCSRESIQVIIEKESKDFDLCSGWLGTMSWQIRLVYELFVAETKTTANYISNSCWKRFKKIK